MFHFLTPLQFLPISLLVTYARISHFHIHSWRKAFLVAGVSAALVIVSCLYQKVEMNRFLLAVNLYLLVGGAAFYFNWYNVLEVYSHLQQAVLFIFLLCVGLYTTFFSPTGFIQISDQPEYRVKIYSYFLLFGVGVALVAAYLFEGNVVYAGYVPYLVLVGYRLMLVWFMKSWVW